MGIELREAHERLRAGVDRFVARLSERQQFLCPTDGVELAPDGHCNVCRRQVTEVGPLFDLVPPPDSTPQQAEALRAFSERYNALLKERTTGSRKGDDQPRDWSRVLTAREKALIAKDWATTRGLR
jgi:hypothetical protein